ncbi:protein tyrosine kinase [Ostertagia ostertagi]
MSSPALGASIEKDLLEVWKTAQVERFQQSLVFTLHIRRLDHISHVKDKEFQAIGLSPSQIRSLRSAASEAKKQITRRNADPELIYIRGDNLVDHSTVDPNKAVISRSQIKLMEPIGEGTFSIVKRGKWYNSSGSGVDVAVKILREVSPSIMEDLQAEASHLLKLQHPNLIRLYGVVSEPAMMVFELCEGGELLSRLRDTSKPVPLVTTLLDYCVQVVKALTFLESKHYVHRDVAARNILLSKDEKVVKLCDFGLMRSLKENERAYVMHAQNRVPFSWCPPESLRHRKFSHASDVWAFGVTAWEIFTLGEDPWIGCRAIDVLKRLDAGERLEKPRFCSQQIYDLVVLCWNIDPDLRPKFSLLRTLLLGAEFNVAEVRDATQSGQKENMLEMSLGDKIIVIDNSGLLWYGQNERTRKFGKFLRSSVFVHGKSMVNHSQRETAVSVGNSRISLPIRGSFFALRMRIFQIWIPFEMGSNLLRAGIDVLSSD